MLVSWAHRVSGDYATSDNWSPAVVPGPSDDVSISVNGTYTVTSSVDEAVNSLSILDKHATLLIEGTIPPDLRPLRPRPAASTTAPSL